MPNSANEIERHNLVPGGMYCSDRPAVVTTVIGSCLALTMYADNAGLGAICHPMLPVCPAKQDCRAVCAEPGRFVDCAIRELLSSFLARGCSIGDIKVKLFGGADMFERDTHGEKTYSVGELNILEAKKRLSEEGLTIAAADTGGRWGRKVIFFTHTGEVYMKRITPAEGPE